MNTQTLADAEDQLRMIRDAVVKAKAVTNFAGLSSIFAGLASIAGSFVQRLYVMGIPS